MTKRRNIIFWFHWLYSAEELRPFYGLLSEFYLDFNLLLSGDKAKTTTYFFTMFSRFFQKLTQIWDKLWYTYLNKRTWTARCIFATSSNNRLSQFLERTLKKELFSNFFLSGLQLALIFLQKKCRDCRYFSHDIASFFILCHPKYKMISDKMFWTTIAYV